MGTLNRCTIIGYLGFDPEVKYTQSQEAVTKYRVAVSEKWTGKDGKARERTTWFSCVLWGRRGPALAPYLHKGSHVYIEGRIQTREWDDKDGQRHWAWDLIVEELQLLDRAPKTNGEAKGEPAAVREPGQDFGDDDIPF